MISKNDCLLILTKLSDEGIDTSEQVKNLLKESEPFIETIKYINSQRQLDVTRFYEKLRKSYNNKKSKLYINIVKDIENPKNVLITLSSLNLQILLFSNQVNNYYMFLKHVRAEEIVKVLDNYYKTYDIPVMITRSSNNFGPRQFPEKLIPLFILKAIHNESLPVYGDGKNVRDWIYVEDNCAGVDTVLHKGKIGEVYNIGGGNERNNLEITKLILEKLNKPESLITHVDDRLGHDRRYSLDASKTKKLGWEPKWTFEDAMEETVNWYKNNANRLYKSI